MYREPKLPHVLCGLSFCEACHFVRPIPVVALVNITDGLDLGKKRRKSVADKLIMKYAVFSAIGKIHSFLGKCFDFQNSFPNPSKLSCSDWLLLLN